MRDFGWWSNTTLTEARAALAKVSGELVELEFGGTSYWLAPETAALLDDGVLPPEHAQKIVPGGNGVFKKAIVAGGEVVGTWARQGTVRAARFIPEPFDDARPLGPAALAGFNRSIERYERFLAS